MIERQQQLHHWLKNQFTDYGLAPIQGDASFRQYYRLTHKNLSYIVMDAPPALEACQPFVAIAKVLNNLTLKVPEVISADIQQGFLLLTDFGNNLLLKVATPENFYQLYQNACGSLATLLTCNKVDGHNVPYFDQKFMRNELALAQEWFLQKHLQIDLSSHQEELNAFFDFLCASAVSQPQVFMHRDFQTANLMVLENNKIGILDFQDAMIGPITYDLVSLLKDCYLMWPEKLITQLALDYKKQVYPQVSDKEFIRWFDLMGLQRHIKALMIFARKFHRDQNANYLRHMPRTLNYIYTTCSRYKECKDFFIFLNEVLLPTFEKGVHQCMQ